MMNAGAAHSRMMRDDEFDRLYQEHAQGLFGFLVYRTGSRPVAEYLLAGTCERGLRGRRLCDGRKASAKTWLYTIALNLLRDDARRRTAEERALERANAGVSPEEPAAMDRVERSDELERALAGLSQEERDSIA